MVLLGLDLGTTNVKAMLADAQGKVLGLGSAPVQLSHGEAGLAEQELGEVQAAATAAIRDATSGADGRWIRAIGVSSQGGAMLVLDAAGAPISRVISWLDGRGREEDAALAAELGEGWFARRLGHRGSGMAIGQILRLRREQPAWIQPPNRIGFVGDTFVAGLCGRGAHDATSSSIALLYNPSLNDYDPELLARLALSRDQLPEIVPIRVPAGALLAEPARQLGIPAGIPVSAAIHDQYAAALGSGVTRAGQVMFGAGTAWVLLAVTDHRVEPVAGAAFVCPHPVPGLYGQIVSLHNGGSALGWVRQFVAANSGPADLEDLIGSVEPGCGGLSFWPFLAATAPAGLAPGTMGRFDGLRLGHRPAHLVRAVVEGLAFELGRHLDFLREAGGAPEQLILCGGAASGQVTPQLIADVTGLPLHTLKISEAGCSGAVMVARGMLEPGRGLDEICAEVAPAATVFLPGPERAFYQEAFRRYIGSLPWTE